MELIEDELLKIVSLVGRKELLYLGIVSEIRRWIEANHVNHFLFLTDEILKLRDICSIRNQYARVSVVGRAESFEIRHSLICNEVDVVESIA